ncbi:MAG: IgGFc-binding protein [Myxococcota bacterium]
MIDAHHSEFGWGRAAWLWLALALMAAGCVDRTTSFLVPESDAGDAGGEISADGGADVGADGDPGGDVDAVPDATPDADALADADAPIDADAAPDADADALADADAVATPDADADADATPDADADATADATPDADITAPPLPCDDPALLGSHLGCAFWTVDLPNYPETFVTPTPKDTPHVVELVNPGPVAATVSFESTTGGTVPPDATVPPGQSVTVSMPVLDAAATGIENLAIRITSTHPIAVWQRSEATDHVSVDASLLLPESALGTSYAITTRATAPLGAIFPGTPDQRGFFTVVAIMDSTVVTFTPSTDVAPGPGVVATAAGEPRLMTLGRGDTVTIFGKNPSAIVGADLTGSLVTSDLPIAVFAGHEEAVNAPGGGAENCCADMLQVQLFPGESQTGEVLALRSPPRAAESDLWVVQALADEIEVTLTPDPTGQSGASLSGVGATIEIASSTSFQVSATGPVQVFQILAAGEVSGGLGDPAMTVMIPTSRLLARYDVFLPAEYDGRVSIARRAGATVSVDGVLVEAGALAALPGTDWHTGFVKLAPGVHTVTGSAPFAAQVYGYTAKGAFAAPAGFAPAP